MSECEKYDKEKLQKYFFELQTKIATPKGGKLKKENFCKIVSLYRKIKELEHMGITADAYKTFRATALDDYGIRLNEKYPFENPTDIYKQIDLILRDDKLNEKQRKKFYDFTGIRKRQLQHNIMEPAVKLHEDVKNLFKSVSDEDSLPVVEDDNDILEDPYYEQMTKEEYNEDCKLRYEESDANYRKKIKEDKKIAKIKKLQYINPLS